MSGLQIVGLRTAAVVAGLTVGLMACSGSAPPEVPEGADGEQDPVLVLGRDVFASECSNCHGSAGGGKRGPRLSGGSVVERFPDVADQVALVTNGRAGMPTFASKLSAAEIEAVVLYTREVL
jgi:mono/diheme cytochrome c family protein